MQFDGVTRFSGAGAWSFNGFVLHPFNTSGTYTITSDCVVSLHEETLGLVFEGFFTRDKSQVLLFQPQSFTVTTNTLRQTPPSPCDAGSSKDNWVIQASGKNIGTGQLFVQTGKLQFDGLGGLNGTIASSVGGLIVNHNVSGSYAISRDCSLTLTITDESANTSHLFGVLYGDGNEFYFIYQDPGVVITGTAKKGTKG